MFNAAVFTIAKTKKQPKCPSKDKLIKDLWYIDIMEHYLAIKNNKIIPFGATRMQVEIFIRSEVTSYERERKMPYYISYVELKYGTNELIYKRETNSGT